MSHGSNTPALFARSVPRANTRAHTRVRAEHARTTHDLRTRDFNVIARTRA